MADDPVLIIMGVLGTFVMIALTIFATGVFNPDVEFKFKRDIILVVLIVAVMFCIWWSIPFAWFRGMLFDPLFAILGAMIMAFAVISGCIESESAYKKRKSGGRR